MKIRPQYFIFLFFVLLSFLITGVVLWRSSWHQSGPVEAAAFGISPPHFQNLSMQPGEAYYRNITLMRTNTASTRIIHLNLDTPGFADWFTFLPGSEFSFWEGEDSTSFNIKVQVPETASSGIYKGTISVAIGPSYDQGVAISLGARINVELHVLGPSNSVMTNTFNQMINPPIFFLEIKDEDLYERLNGRFIIRAENRGELYYVSPDEPKLYHLVNRDITWQTLKEMSIGINEENINKIKSAPVAESDSDNEFAQRLAGRALLQTETNGKLWYVNPDDLHRYLNSPIDAFVLAQILAIGIGEVDYNKFIN